MIILGIDPGLASMGYGLISFNKRAKKKLRLIKYGCITTDKGLASEQRLKLIYNQIDKIIREHKPKALIVEKLFFFKNAKTAIPVSQAKGVILLVGAKKKIPVYELTPLETKMKIVGYGWAEKTQMQEMIKKLLKLKDIPQPDDAADALGLAISGAYLLEPR